MTTFSTFSTMSSIISPNTFLIMSLLSIFNLIVLNEKSKFTIFLSIILGVIAPALYVDNTTHYIYMMFIVTPILLPILSILNIKGDMVGTFILKISPYIILVPMSTIGFLIIVYGVCTLALTIYSIFI